MEGFRSWFTLVDAQKYQQKTPRSNANKCEITQKTLLQCPNVCACIQQYPNALDPLANIFNGISPSGARPRHIPAGISPQLDVKLGAPVYVCDFKN